MRFTKMQGAGNDFVVADNMDKRITLTPTEIRRLCDRHFGIGGDGLILVEPSETADIFMNYYNADGTTAEMCGNGMRCTAKFAMDHGIVTKERFVCDTRAGHIGVKVLANTPKEARIQVAMGEVCFDSAAIPVVTDKPELIGETIAFGDRVLTFGCASMGNPHMTIVVDDFDAFPIDKAGPYFEAHPMFPKHCNISFAQVLDRGHIRMDTWERGAGRTLACGTGTCAAVAVLNRMHLVDDTVEATLSGGKLTIGIQGRAITMTGPAVAVFDGTVAIEAF